MDFYMPARLLTGRDVVRKNADRIAAFGRRCLIVTSGSAAKRCGALDDVTGVLTEKGIAYEVFDGIRPNPSMYSCVDGGRAAERLPLHAVGVAGLAFDEAGVGIAQRPEQEVVVAETLHRFLRLAADDGVNAADFVAHFPRHFKQRRRTLSCRVICHTELLRLCLFGNQLSDMLKSESTFI